MDWGPRFQKKKKRRYWTEPQQSWLSASWLSLPCDQWTHTLAAMTLHLLDCASSDCEPSRLFLPLVNSVRHFVPATREVINRHHFNFCNVMGHVTLYKTWEGVALHLNSNSKKEDIGQEPFVFKIGEGSFMLINPSTERAEILISNRVWERGSLKILGWWLTLIKIWAWSAQRSQPNGCAFKEREGRKGQDIDTNKGDLN